VDVVCLPGELEFAVTLKDGRVLGWPREGAQSGGATDAAAPDAWGDPARREVWRELARVEPPAVLARAPDAGRFAAAGADGVVHLWSSDGERLAQHVAMVDGARAAVVGLEVPPGTLVLALTEAGDVQVLGGDAGPRTLATVARVTALACSPAGDLVATGYADSSAACFELPSCALRTTVLADPSRRSEEPHVRAVAFTSDGARIVLASHNNWLDACEVVHGARLGPGIRREVRWIEALAGGLVFTHANAVGSGCAFELEADASGATIEVVTGTAGTAWEKLHALDVTCIDASPDGRYVLTASLDGTVHVSDSVTGSLVALYDRHGGPVVALDVGSDGRVASASLDGTVAVWPIDPVPDARALAPRPLSAEEKRRLDLLVGGG
jgi:WD40 repeat protein